MRVALALLVVFVGVASAQAADFHVQTGHEDRVRALAIAPGGEYAATAGDDGAVLLWDMTTRRVLDRFDGSVGSASAVAFSPDGEWLVAGDNAGHVRRLTASGLAQKSVFATDLSHIYHVSVLSGGDVVVSGLERVERWTRRGRRVWSVATDGKGAAVSPDGDTVVAGTSILDASTGRRRARFKVRRGQVQAVAFAPDGSRFATGANGQVAEWDTDGGAIASHGATGYPGCLGYSPDSERLFACDEKLVRVWSADGKERGFLEGHEDDVRALAVGEGTVLTTGDDRSLRVWSDPALEPLAVVPGVAAKVTAIATGTERIYVGVAPGYIKASRLQAWDVGGKLLWNVPAHEDVPGGLALSPDGARLASVGSDGYIKLWDAQTGVSLRSGRLRLASGKVGSLAWAADGATLYAVGQHLEIRDGATLEVQSKIKKPCKYGAVAAGLMEGSRLFVACWGSVAVFDMATRQEVGRVARPGGETDEVGLIKAAAWLRGGKIVVGGERGLVGIAEPSRGAFKLLGGATMDVRTVAVAHDRSRFVTGGGDWRKLIPELLLWPESGAPRRLEGHRNHVFASAFLGDRHLVTGAWETGVQVRSLERDASMTLVGIDNSWVAWSPGAWFDASPDGAALLSVSLNGRALGVDQFAVRLNRPDKMLRAMGLGSPELHAELEAAHKTRMSRLGVAAEPSPGTAAPTVSITAIDHEPGSRVARLRVALEDDRGLASFQIYVDGVPLFPGGMPVDGRRDVAALEVPLLEGSNHLEVVARNIDGIESPRVPTRIDVGGTGTAQLFGNRWRIADIAVSPGGEWVGTAGARKVAVYDHAQARGVREIRAADQVTSLAFDADGRLIFGTQKGTVFRVDAEDGDPVAFDLYLGSDPVRGGVIAALGVSDDGARVVAAGDKVLVFDAGSGRVVSQHEFLTNATAAEVGPGGEVVAGGQCATRDDKYRCLRGEVVLWSREGLKRFEVHRGLPRSIAFHPSGELAVSGADDGTVSVWTMTGEVLRTARLHRTGVGAVAISPDGASVLSADQGGRALFWDLATGKVVRELQGHAQGVTAAAFSPDGLTAYTANRGRDAKARRWDLRRAGVRGDLYFVGLGVSDYQDPAIPDLEFAHRDVLDLAAHFTSLGDSYDAVHVSSFTNAQVDAGALDAVRSLLAGARPVDTLVLFVAGHGVRVGGSTARYYFLTHDTKVADLAGTALPYDAIEALLYDSPPRHKLFLQDTCQSGEGGVGWRPPGPGTTARAMRGGEWTQLLTLSGTQPLVVAASRQDRFVTLDLRRRSGAIVFSSSRGNEASLESGRWENGAFTEAILEALRGDDADGNKDGRVSTRELRRYVIDRVPKMTADGQGRPLQHPVVDRDNVLVQFGFPLPPVDTAPVAAIRVPAVVRPAANRGCACATAPSPWAPIKLLMRR